MNFVLDTNAVSETAKPRPNPGLVAWLAAQDAAHLFVTTVTLGEVWNGFHRLQPDHPDYERIKIFASNRIVTRDAAVFERMGCKVVNPWTA